jgi:hypothetical protein
MESHYTKVSLSVVGVVAMLTSFTFAQKQQYISPVNQSGLFEVLKAAAASGEELPQYEVMGFPISAHQMSVLQSGGIEEQSLTPMLTLQGMPASPHQIAVIGFPNQTVCSGRNRRSRHFRSRSAMRSKA